MASLEELLLAHDRLKKRIHAARFPIKSRYGRAAMGAVYVTVPLVFGYFLMQWTNAARDRNLGGPGRDALKSHVPTRIVATSSGARSSEAIPP